MNASINLAAQITAARNATATDLAQWEREMTRSVSPALVSHPWQVALPDCSVALRQTRASDGSSVLTPVDAEYSIGGAILGGSCYTREDAAAVAAHRGCGFEPVAIRDIPARRVAALRKLLADFDAMLTVIGAQS